MKNYKRFVAWALALILMMGFLPALPTTPAVFADEEEEVEALDVDLTDAGDYLDVSIGSGTNSAFLMNGKFSNLGTSIPNPGGKIRDVNGRECSIDDYNMMRLFGIYYSGRWMLAKQAGFSYSGGQKINAGSANFGGHTLNMATYNDDGGSSGSMTIDISQIPKLNALAEEGGLEMYYQGYACAGKQARKAWPDDHTYIWLTVKVNGATKASSGKASDESKFISTGWVTLSKNSKITLEWSVDRGGKKCSNGWADKDVGIGGSVLLFRKAGLPTVTSCSATVNGDYFYNNTASGTSQHQVLLDKESSMTLDIQLSGTVYSALPIKTNVNADSYKLLNQLANHTLFNNAEGTGYGDDGKAVPLTLVGVNGTNTASYKDGAERTLATRNTALLNSEAGFKSLQYAWSAKDTDFNSNQPILNGADWSGAKTQYNMYSLITKLYMASLHDAAGNPLKIDDKVKHALTGTDFPTLKAQVSLPRQSLVLKTDGKVTQNGSNVSYITTWNAAAPFAWAGYIVDGVTPRFSITANAVQPDVLTGLTLSEGDGFDLYLNFTEGVKTRVYYADGTATNWKDADTKVTFNNGMVADYVSGAGTQNWKFHVTVPDGAETALEGLEVTGFSNGSHVSNTETYYAKVGSGYERVVGRTPFVANSFYTLDMVGHTFATGKSAKLTKVEDNLTIQKAANMKTQYAYMLVDDVMTPVSISLDEGAGLVYYVVRNNVTQELLMECHQKSGQDMIKDKILEGTYYTASPAENTNHFFGKVSIDEVQNNLSGTHYLGIGDDIFAVTITKTTENDVDTYTVKSGSMTLGVYTGSLEGTFYKTQDTGSYYKTSGKSVLPATAADASGIFYTVSATALTSQPTYWGEESILTDYVGNPVLEGIGPGAGDRQISWARLTVDNTVPYLEITDQNKINVSDSLSGLFRVGNTTGSASTAGLFYYTWVKLEEGEYASKDAYETVIVDGETTSQKAPASVAKAVKELTANHFAALKRYSLTVEQPEGYTLYIQNSRSGNELEPNNAAPFDGTYMLVAFAADMSWDSARQLTQYDMFKNNKSTEEGAKEFYTQVLGESAGSAGYVALTEKPDDWETNYSAYYVRSGNSYFSIPTQTTWPTFAENTYYEFAYVSAGDTQPADWEENYTSYYIKEGDSYKRVPAMSVTPAFQANTYYAQYLPVDDENAPADWDTAFTGYYEKNGETYTALSVVPAFEADTYAALTLTSHTLETDGSHFYEATTLSLTEDGSVTSYAKVDGTMTAVTVTRTTTTVEGVSTTTYTVTAGGVQKYSGTTMPAWTFYELANGTYFSYQYPVFSEEEGAAVTFTATANENPQVLAAATAALPSGTFYELSASMLSAQPADWSTNYADYYQRSETAEGSGTYFYAAVEESSVPTYEAGKYYTKSSDASGYTLMTTEPSNWSSAYSEYYTDTNGTKFTYNPWPTYTAGTYYEQGFKLLTGTVENWETRYKKYFALVSGEYVSLTEGQGWVGTSGGVPEFKDGAAILGGTPTTVYETSVDLVEAANKAFNDAARKQAFLEAVGNADSYVTKVSVLEKYAEFNEKIIRANQTGMQKSGAYNLWPASAYQMDDSNWAVTIGTSALDRAAPVIKSANLVDNGTDTPAVTVRVEDESEITAIDYQFIAAGTELDKDSNWAAWVTKTQDVMNESAYESTLAFADTEKGWWYNVDTTATGSYDLWLRMVDAAGNEDFQLAATVSYDKDFSNSTVAVTIMQNGAETTGSTEAARTAEGLTVSVTGSYQNVKPFLTSTSDAKLFYQILSEEETLSEENWTEFTGTISGDAYVAELPALTEGDGLYTIHVRLTFSGKTLDKNVSFTLDNTAPEVTLTQTAVSLSGITVTVFTGDAAKKEYQWTERDLTEAPADGWKEFTESALTYPGEEDTEPIHQLTLWVRAEDALGNQIVTSGDYLLPEEQADIPAPEVMVSAITLTDEGKAAIFNLELEELAYGAEYAYAFTDKPIAVTEDGVTVTLEGETLPLAADGSVTRETIDDDGETVTEIERVLSWTRWKPYESMVKAGLPEGWENMSILFRFRSASGDITAIEVSAEKYLLALAELTETEELFATVARSTVSEISAQTGGGVTLVFTPSSDDVTVTAVSEELTVAENSVKVTANGIYAFTLTQAESEAEPQILYVSVANISDRSPSYKITYNTVNLTTSYVVAAVDTDSDAVVTSILFTNKAGETREYAGEDVFYFSENGTAVFTLENSIGNTATATANVSWIYEPTVRTELRGLVLDSTSEDGYREETFDPNKAYAALMLILTPGGKTPGGDDKLGVSFASVDAIAISDNAEEQEVFVGYQSGEETYRVIRTGTEFRYLLTTNGAYSFQLIDALGNPFHEVLRVNGIAPAFEASVSVEKAVVTVTGKIYGYDKGNFLTWNGTDYPQGCKLNPAGFVSEEGTPVYTPNADGSANFVIARTFTSNGSATTTLRDQVGNSTKLTYEIDSIDRKAPTVTVKNVPHIDSAAALPQTGAYVANYVGEKWVLSGEGVEFWSECFDFSDNDTEHGVVNVTITLPEIDKSTKNGRELYADGSYWLTVTAEDYFGNSVTRRVPFIVAPEGGILVTDENGVLFYSGSTDVALVADDEITLNITGIEEMFYGTEYRKVKNSAATVQVYIQKGLMREGQMKQLLGKLTFDTTRGNGTWETKTTLHINPNELDGSGWYTILVRTSERVREFTTFLITDSLLNRS